MTPAIGDQGDHDVIMVMAEFLGHLRKNLGILTPLLGKKVSCRVRDEYSPVRQHQTGARKISLPSPEGP